MGGVSHSKLGASSNQLTAQAVTTPPVWDGTTKTPFSAASPTNPGTESNPYLIGTGAELAYLAQQVNDVADYSLNKHFKLTADIVLNNTTGWESWNDTNKPTNIWTPIGKGEWSQFKGTFDGANHTVSGIYISGTDESQGLFSSISNNATVKNVGVINSYIKGGFYIGGVVGYVFDNCTVINCYNSGTVSGRNAIGGVVGQSRSGSVVINCYNTGAVNGNARVGGVVGESVGCSVINCYNHGAVSGVEKDIGGVVGSSGVTVINCYNTGKVAGSGDYAKGYVGGVVGYTGGLQISNCFFLTGQITITGKQQTAAEEKAVGTGTGTGAAWNCSPFGPEKKLTTAGSSTATGSLVTFAANADLTETLNAGAAKYNENNKANPKAIKAAAWFVVPSDYPNFIPSVTISGNNIYANGLKITLKAGTAGNTNIYYDKELIKNGDTAISINLIGPTGNTETGYDLSGYTVYGGGENGAKSGVGAVAIDGDTSVTMESGKVTSIYGGGNGDKAIVTGSATVTISGGTITGNVYGGGNNATTGTKTVNISGAPTIGSAATGIIMNGGTPSVSNGVDQFVINGVLNGSANSISLVLPSGFVFRTVATKTSNLTTDDVAKFVLVGDITIKKILKINAEPTKLDVVKFMKSLKKPILGATTSVAYTGKDLTTELKALVTGVTADMTIAIAPATAIDFGEYTITVSINKDTYQWEGGGNEDLTFTTKITKATNSITNLEIAGWTYGATASEPTATANFGTPTFTYSNAQNGTYLGDVPTNAGTYWVKASVVGTTNYEKAELTKEFTIAKAPIDRPTVAGVLTYNGMSQNGVSAANGFTYTTGTTSEKNAGSYTATATLDGNHIWSTAGVGGSFTDAVELTWTIAPKNLSGVTIAAITPVTYNKTAHTPTPEVSWTPDGGSKVVLSAVTDFTFSYTDNINASATAKVTITAVTGKNYTGTLDKVFTINKANIDPTGFETPSAIFYGDTLSESKFVTTTLNGVGGAYSWTPSETTPITNLADGATVPKNATFTPTDNVNYNVVKKDVDLTVNYRTIIDIQAFDPITGKEYATVQTALGLPTEATLTVETLASDTYSAKATIAWGGYNASTIDPQTLTGTLTLPAGVKQPTPALTATISVTLKNRTPGAVTYVAKTAVYNGSPITHEIALPTGVASIAYKYVGIKPTDYIENTIAPTNAGTYSVTATFTMLAGYEQIAATTADLTITPLEATLEWSVPTAADLVYSGTAKVLTATVGNLVNKDECTVTAAVTPTNDNKNVGSFTFTASELGNPNYKLPATVDSGSYTITARPVTITAEDKTSQYKLALAELTCTVTGDGFIAADNITVKLSTDATTESVVRSDYVITPACVDPNAKLANYTVRINNGKYTIIPQVVDNPIPAAQSFKYNGVEQIFVITANDRYTITGDKQTLANAKYTATATLKDKKNYEWNNGETANGTADLTFDWSIAKATPTVSVTVNDVVYGTIGNLPFNFTADDYTCKATGVDADSATFGGTIAVTYTAKSGETSNAGKLKVNTYTANWTFTPTNTTNYESVSGTQTFKVTPITIKPTIKTEEATAISKEYDKTAGATVVAGDVVLGGLIPSDDVALTFTATYDNKNVGANKAVTVHYTAITGADIDNYSLTGGDLTGYTGAITAKELTATWGKNAFTYDGTAQAPTATLTAIDGDAITYAVTGAKTNATQTGVIPIATVAFNGTGADNGNYTIKNIKQPFTIAQKAVTVAQKAGSTLTKIYDGNNNCDTTFAKDTQYEIIGVENTDKAALDITITSKVFDNANVSATKVIATFTLNEYGITNYSCEATTFEHTATITPIKLTITKAPTAQQLSKAYDGLTSFAVSNIKESDYVVTRTDKVEVLPKGYSLNVQSVEFESNAISAVMGKDNVTVTMAKNNDVGGANLNRNFELSNITFKMDGRIVNSDAQAGTDYIVTLNNGITDGTSGIKDGVTYASGKVTFAVGKGKYEKIRKTATDTWADSIEFTENATSIAFQLKKKGVEEFEIVVVPYGIDKANPTIANEQVIDIDVVGEKGFFKDNLVKVSFVVADIDSGIAKIELKKGGTIVTHTLSDKAVVYEIVWAENNPINDTYVLTITDYAGRTATKSLVVVKHDSAAPTISAKIGENAIDYTKWVGVGKIDFTLSDATSGIKTKVWTADGSLGATVADTFSHTFANGHHSFKLVVTDNAGNSTTLEQPLLVDNNIATFMTEYNKFAPEATGAEKDKKAAALNALFEGYTVTQKEHITGKDSSNAEADTAYKALQTYITGRKSQIEAERISQETDRVKAEITAIMGKNPIPQSDLENFVKQLPISKEVEGKLTPEQKQHIVDIVAVEKVVDLLNAKPNNNAQLENWLKTYNALTETQKTLAQKAVETLAERNTTYVGYKTAVDELIAGAKDLNSVNATNKAEVNALIAKYNALIATNHLPSGITSKALVPQNVAAKIEKWIASIAKATAVDGKIGAIGGVPTDYTKDFNNEVVDAEKAYNELTADEKTLVANAKTLEDAKKANDELKKKLATSNKAAAEVADFESKFVEFPAKPTIKDVLEIYEKYEKLSTEAKAILDATTKTDLDAWKTAADAVFGKDSNSKIINRIENIDLKKLENATAEEIATIKAEIESVITEYGKLSGQQKDLVDNTVGGKCDKLVDLKARLDVAEKAIKDIPKENADGNHDCGLCKPGSGTGHDTDGHQTLIEKAKIAYEKLSAIERKLLNSDSVTTMETQYEILKDYLSKLAQQKIIKDKADKEDVSVYGLATLVETSTVPDITIADTIVISVDAKKTDTEMTDMDEDKQKVVSFDVKLMAKAGNNEAVQIQPKENQKVVVKLALGQIYAHEKIQIYHNKNDGSRELVQNVNFIDEGNQTYAIFETSSFSEFFALTEKSNEIYVPDDSIDAGGITSGAIFDKSIENEIRFKDTNPVVVEVFKQENTLSKSILDAIKDAESGKVITVIFKEGEISITKEKLKGIVVDKKSYTYAELKALLETPEIIPTPTPTPTEKPTEPTEPTAKKCWLCGVCPMFLGLCLWIWLAIAVVAVAVVVIIVVKKKKKNDDEENEEDIKNK